MRASLPRNWSGVFVSLPSVGTTNPHSNRLVAPYVSMKIERYGADSNVSNASTARFGTNFLPPCLSFLQNLPRPPTGFPPLTSCNVEFMCWFPETHLNRSGAPNPPKAVENRRWGKGKDSADGTSVPVAHRPGNRPEHTDGAPVWAPHRLIVSHHVRPTCHMGHAAHQNTVMQYSLLSSRSIMTSLPEWIAPVIISLAMRSTTSR